MTSEKLPPPYVTYGTFKAHIDEIAKSTVPTTLNRHVVQGLSGGDYSALISALRFFGLIDSENRTNAKYSGLVAAAKSGTEPYKKAFKPLLDEHYKSFLGNLDIQRGTLTELEKCFADHDVQRGQMLTKTVRFIIKALMDCGVTVSPHITKAKARTKGNGTKKQSKKSEASSAAQMPPPPPDQTPSGFEDMKIPGVPGSFIRYPVNITEAQCGYFKGMLAVLESVAKDRVPKDGATK